MALEGSFSLAYVSKTMCARYTPIRNGRAFCANVIRVVRLVVEKNLGCHVFDFGELTSSLCGDLYGVVVVSERLHELPDAFSDEPQIFEQIERVNLEFFHNDLKVNNIMLTKSSEVRLIDFDFMHPSKICVPVNSHSVIDLDFSQFFEGFPQASLAISKFRTLYDYTTLSLSVPGEHPLFCQILARLHTLFQVLLEPVLKPLLVWLPPEKLRDLPMEVLVRCPGIEAVSVNLLDLRGNAFAHNVVEWQSYPSLVRSNGVYWPDR